VDYPLLIKFDFGRVVAHDISQLELTLSCKKMVKLCNILGYFLTLTHSHEGRQGLY